MRQKNDLRSTLSCLAVAIPVLSCAASTPASDPSHFDHFVPSHATDTTLPYPRPSACEQELPTQPNAVELPVPLINQSTPYTRGGRSELCWAAVVAMVSTGLGNPRNTCHIATYLTFDGMSCCRFNANTGSDAEQACNKPAPESVIDIILHNMGIYNVHAWKPLSEEELRHELSQGRPVIVQVHEGNSWTFQNGRGSKMSHVMVVAGYTGGEYRILDPDTYPEQKMTYSQLARGTDRRPWTWEATWHHFSFRTDGCNPLFNAKCACDAPSGRK